MVEPNSIRCVTINAHPAWLFFSKSTTAGFHLSVSCQSQAGGTYGCTPQARNPPPHRPNWPREITRKPLTGAGFQAFIEIRRDLSPDYRYLSVSCQFPHGNLARWGKAVFGRGNREATDGIFNLVAAALCRKVGAAPWAVGGTGYELSSPTDSRGLIVARHLQGIGSHGHSGRGVRCLRHRRPTPTEGGVESRQ